MVGEPPHEERLRECNGEKGVQTSLASTGETVPVRVRDDRKLQRPNLIKTQVSVTECGKHYVSELICFGTLICIKHVWTFHINI